MSADLQAEVERFAEDVGQLLHAVFSDAPTPVAERRGVRYVVEPEPVPLTVNGDHLADLSIIQWFCLDSDGEYLAVEKSTFSLAAAGTREPLIRWEFERDAHTKPHAHVHVHAERGAMTHLLSRSGHTSPASLWSVHVPVGGARFRPCLEDVVQFLVVECRFDKKNDWRAAVDRGRESWRRLQLRTAVRDAPGEAADVLRQLGYTVDAPSNREQEDRLHKLRAW
jgi:hypothetical protein